LEDRFEVEFLVGLEVSTAPLSEEDMPLTSEVVELELELEVPLVVED
jgi:hypothetical protein